MPAKIEEEHIGIESVADGTLLVGGQSAVDVDTNAFFAEHTPTAVVFAFTAPVPALAADTEPAIATVQGFYDNLTAADIVIDVPLKKYGSLDWRP